MDRYHPWCSSISATTAKPWDLLIVWSSIAASRRLCGISWETRKCDTLPLFIGCKEAECRYRWCWLDHRYILYLCSSSMSISAYILHYLTSATHDHTVHWHILVSSHAYLLLRTSSIPIGSLEVHVYQHSATQHVTIGVLDQACYTIPVYQWFIIEKQ